MVSPCFLAASNHVLKLLTTKHSAPSLNIKHGTTVELKCVRFINFGTEKMKSCSREAINFSVMQYSTVFFFIRNLECLADCFLRMRALKKKQAVRRLTELTHNVFPTNQLCTLLCIGARHICTLNTHTHACNTHSH